jgi:hypothetical protein
MTERHTGLCTWALRNAIGEYIYDPKTCGRGYDLGSAHLWLWTAESVETELAALRARMGWTMLLTAVRGRQ